MMVNLDPATSVQNPAVLRAVVQQHATCASVGCTVVRPGRIRQGDAIYLTRDRSAGTRQARIIRGMTTSRTKRRRTILGA